MSDVIFGSKGAAQVAADQQKLRDGAKALAALYQQENKELSAVGQAATRAFKSTLSDMEKLQLRAKQLENAVKNTKLTDEQRSQAAVALERTKQKMRELRMEGDKTRKGLVEAFGGAKNAIFGPFVTAAGGAAAAVGAILKVVSDEIRANQELVNKSVASQLTVGASRNVVIRNLPGASDKLIQQVLEENQQLAADTGVSETAINQARGEALSASGGNIEASRKATKVAAQFLADKPSEIGGFAGSLLDLSKVTGTTDANVNLGLLSAVGGQSRITDPRAQAQNIAPALIGARKFGFSVQDSAALLATITGQTGDLKGATSGTALIQLAKQLEEFNPDDQLAGLTTGQKLRRLQQDEGLAAQFLDNASFEVKTVGTIRSLFDRESEDARVFRSQLRAFPDKEGLRERGRDAIRSFDNNKLEETARRSRLLSSTLEQLRVSGPQENLSEQEVADLKGLLVKAGATSLGAGLDISLERGLDRLLSMEEAAGLLERQIEMTEQGTNADLAADVSDETLMTLKEVVEQLRQGNMDRKEQTRKIGNSGTVVGAD